MADDALLCVGQKAYIEKDGKLLILNDPIMGPDLPGGKIQVGETDFPEALKREVKEETGLEIEVLQPFHTWYFEWPEGHRNYGKKAVVIDYKCKYVSGDIILSDEHAKFIWINKESWKKYFKKDNGYFDSLVEYFK